MLAAQYKPSPTVQCTDCNQLCPAVSNQLTAQCTDQCVVIACRDPTHDVPTDCTVHESSTPCGLACGNDTNCVDCVGFDAFLQCCNDYHGYFSEPKGSGTRPNCAPAPPGWDVSGWNWCINCHGDSVQESMPPASPIAVPQAPFSANDFAQGQASPFFSPSALPEKCMWNDCKESFATLSDLVGHVNLVHLRPSGATPAPQQVEAPMPVVDPATDFADSLACLWDHCSTDVTPQTISGPSTAPELNSTPFSALETHLLRDHLGLNLAHLAALRNDKGSSLKDLLPSHDAPTEEPLGDSRQSSPQTDAGVHQCNWQGCDAWFASCDDLTAHLNATHVGSGKAQYECFWAGCNRNGAQGFSSKQKICRHLQSHTGHRPYQCQICQQNFSEAATLQQHMRRHTQERPYVCDFPGCSKSFAIMGALTIHKRTHNGLKPFKCKFCDKAFSESSNLSKHLRTHTGARPYSCAEPGCGKSFSRPDQLNRHMAVHRKNTDTRGMPAQ